MNPSLESPVGLIAGNGSFPVEFALAAKERGLEVIAVAHHGETDPSLESLVKKCTWIKAGQIGKMLSALKEGKVRQAAFAGGITKVKLFTNFQPDLKAIMLLAKARSTKDDVILRLVAGELESLGIEIFSASVLLEKSVPKPGILTRRRPSTDEFNDGMIGWEAAREIGRLDIGQTVVVAKGAVVAVEAVEGTDACIKRGFELSGGGGVIVKLCKPQQDLRFDLPTIGVRTIEKAVEARIKAIFVEAGRSLMLDPEKVIQAADRAGIAIVAATTEEDLKNLI